MFIESLMASGGGFHYIVHEYGITPFQLISHHVEEYKTLITAMFIHAGWVHFLDNTLYLWIFGNNIEDALWKINFIFLYHLRSFGVN